MGMTPDGSTWVQWNAQNVALVPIWDWCRYLASERIKDPLDNLHEQSPIELLPSISGVGLHF